MRPYMSYILHTISFFKHRMNNGRNTRKNLRLPEIQSAVTIVHYDPINHSPVVSKLIKHIESNKETFCNGDDELLSLVYEQEPSIYFILHDPTNIEVVYGFGIASMGQTYLYLTLLCANTTYKGAGTLLMKEIVNYAKSKGATSIHIMADAEAVGFYKKLGFNASRQECQPARMCSMVLDLTTSGGRTRKHRRTRKYRK